MTHPVLKKMQVLREEAKLAIKSSFKDYFDSHPEVESIEWTQYAPYFNDGDACVFHVHSFTFKPTVEYKESLIPEESPDDDDDSYDDDDSHSNDVRRILYASVGAEYDYRTRGYTKGSKRGLTENVESIIKDADDLEELCRDLKDEMKSTFTDDGKIIASRSGFDVVEYDHE